MTIPRQAPQEKFGFTARFGRHTAQAKRRLGETRRATRNCKCQCIRSKFDTIDELPLDISSIRENIRRAAWDLCQTSYPSAPVW